MWLPLLLSTATLANGAVLPRQNLPSDETSADPFSLPNSQNVQARSSQLSNIRSNFQYGPDVVGPGGAYYPAGSYADKMIKYDKDLLFQEQIPWTNACTVDALAAIGIVELQGGLNKLDDWKKLYEGFSVVLPGGPYPGILDNGTSDLLFSMERLSAAPLGVRRIAPSESLSFSISDDESKEVSTLSLADLQTQGLLFYVDHRSIANQPLTEGRYAAATDAFFFIHPHTSDFLPLAIRMNRGSNLTYTPADAPTDWLFAKMAFNMNNLWFEQWFHLETTHYIADIVFMAAVRTLNQDHPVYGILDRLAYQTFSFRLDAITTLVNKGGPVDELFFSDGSSAALYGNDLYNNQGAGDWLNTEFTTDLQQRGLINCSYGPELKHFPFYEDASVINSAIDAFATSYVHAFYADDAAVANDSELQAFVAETGPAKVINFAPSIATRADLVAFIRHFAMTTSVRHTVTNSDEPVHTTATLPYHPMSFYQPLPTSKGLTDIVPLMPNVTQSAGQITLLAVFNHPWISEESVAGLFGADRTLVHMFDLPSFLARTNDAVRAANEGFKSAMEGFSRVVQARGFDAQGLSQGMPFVWKVLDPMSSPFYLTI